VAYNSQIDSSEPEIVASESELELFETKIEVPPLLAKNVPDEVKSRFEPDLEEEEVKKESGTYRFVNRRVPVFDNTLSPSTSVSVLVDGSDNRWVWFGKPEDNDQLLSLAIAIDTPVEQLDLDFVLVSVSHERLKRYGLTAIFAEGASVFTAAELGFDIFTGSLALGNISLGASFQNAVAGSWIVSSPQIRTAFGEPFAFESGNEVPIESTVVSDGVVSSDFTYRSVGLGFSGEVAKVGNRIDARIRFTNSLIVDGSRELSAPEFQTQSATLRGFLEWHRWSLFAALKVDAESLRKGIFSKRSSKTEDLLLVFIRPRDTLLNSKALIVPKRLDFDDTWSTVPDFPFGVLPSK